MTPLRCLSSRLSRQPVSLPHHDRIRRKIWTLSPSKGQSPSSRGLHGVEEQVSPIAPRTPLIFMRRAGIKEPNQLPNGGSDRGWTFRARD